MGQNFDGVTFTIKGQPFSKANSRKIVSFGKRAASIKSDKAREYERSAIEQINVLMDGKEPLEGDVSVSMDIYYPSRRQDLDESLILDVMQERKDRKTGKIVCKGIYLNDRQVKHKKDIVWHLDPSNPRTTITVRKIT